MKNNSIDYTIDLQELWHLFTLIKSVNFGSSVKITPTFKADPELLYKILQKELNANSRISMN